MRWQGTRRRQGGRQSAAGELARLASKWLLMACCLALIAGCAAPPIVQVGVLAPFEGLYRRSGYVALDTTREVIESARGGDVGLLPLALDTSRDSVRAMQKLRASPGLGAVLGPQTPQEAAGGAETLAGIPWFAPWAVDASGFVDPGADSWLGALLGAAAEDAARMGVQSLAVAGWVPPSVVAVQTALPLNWIDSPLAVRSGEGVLWLGDAAAGARFVAVLRQRLPGTPVWLAPWAGDPVFGEHLVAAGLGDWKRIHWIVWLNEGYSAWAATHGDSSPLAYVLEQAARQAVAGLQHSPLPLQTWRPTFFELTPSGEIISAAR